MISQAASIQHLGALLFSCLFGLFCWFLVFGLFWDFFATKEETIH